MFGMSGFQTINTSKISFYSDDSLVISNGKLGYVLDLGMNIIRTRMFFVFNKTILTTNTTNTTKKNTPN